MEKRPIFITLHNLDGFTLSIQVSYIQYHRLTDVPDMGSLVYIHGLPEPLIVQEDTDEITARIQHATSLAFGEWFS